jgi:hypothetical protein
MSERVVKHEIKLEKEVKIILGVLSVGVLLNAFAIWYGFYDGLSVYVDGSLQCYGCN